MSTVKTNNVQVGQSATTTNNFTLYQPAVPDGTVRLGNGNSGAATDVLTVTSGGNLGLGVTPSAWGIKAMQVDSSSIASSSNDTYIQSNAFFDGNWKYINAAEAAQYYQVNGAHVWRTAASGTTNNIISFTQAMTLDASGNLGIGTTTPDAKLHVVGGDVHIGESGQAQGTRSLRIWRGDSTTQYANISASAGAMTLNMVNGAGGGLIVQGDGTERLRVDAGGNLGVGVIPSAWGASSKAIEFGFSGSALFASSVNNTSLLSNAYYNGTNFIYASSNAASRYQQTAGSHQWLTASSGTAGNTITFTQSMALNSTGTLLVGKTVVGTPDAGHYFTSDGQASHTIVNAAANSAALICRRDTTTGTTVAFQYGTTSVGSIAITASATAYNTSSDYRLKHDIAPMQGALARVQQLKPVTYKWNADNSDGEGFIAHELAEVCPQAVTGEKDAVDADGKPVYQGIDTSFLVATLTAAIQEQQAIITELRSRIEALEAK